MLDRVDNSSVDADGPVDSLALDVAWLQVTGLSNELQAQRNQRDAVRTRAIALFSAGAVVFGFIQAQSSSSHLDAWLLASLVALVMMGFCLAYILLPASIYGTPRLNPDDFETGTEYWRSHIHSFRSNVKENQRWENGAGLLHGAVACLLLVEASLIAAHFSSPGFRVAIVVLTSVGLLGCVYGPLRKALAVIEEIDPDAFRPRVWAALRRVRVIRDLPPEQPSLQDAALQSFKVSPPTPGFVIEDRPDGARELEEALARREDAGLAIRTAHVLTLGQIAGDISANGKEGSETDLLHVSDEENGKGRVWVPAFTAMPHMATPLREHRDWQNLSILELDGAGLMDALDDDVEVRINPGSDDEGRIPPGGGNGGPV
ncbi:MAG: SseB family protein [Solirubrobacterales bacterium]